MNSEEIIPQPVVSRRRWWIHLILIGGYFAVHIPLAFFDVRRTPLLTSTARGFLIVSSAEIIVFSLIFGLGCLASRASRDDLLLRWRPGIWVVPLGIGYSVAIRVAVGCAFFIILFFLLGSGLLTVHSVRDFAVARRPNVEKLVDVSALRNNPAYFWLTLTVGSFIVAGLREELWRSGTLAAMRALWPNKFAGRNGQFIAISLIAVVFGAGHLKMGIAAAVVAGFLGILLGAIMVLHRSIWPAVIAHGMFDATTFALLPRIFEHLLSVQ